MTTSLTVYGFETSNNVKVRLALGHKQLPYYFRTIDPADRTSVIDLSGQHLTPVLVHGETVLCDSAAILRYLDCAFRETPRLFGGSRDEQWEIEDWEFFGRTELAFPMLRVVHRRVSGRAVDDALVQRGTEETAAAIAKLGDRLDGRSWLVGDALTAADITAAAVLWRLQTGGIFSLPVVPPHVSDWHGRVMGLDGVARRG